MIGVAARAYAAAPCHRDTVDMVRYRLVVEGEVGPRYSEAFDGMSIECVQGNTVIVGPVADQAQLHGLLDRIASLGLKLVSVTPENGTG